MKKDLISFDIQKLITIFVATISITINRIENLQFSRFNVRLILA